MKIAVAMSGGVDSSLGAAMLKEEGHEVTGVYLDCWEEPGCKVDPNRKDAMKIGLKLGIPMKVLDFKKEYKERVMDWFFAEVKKGRTPNPDVWCNKEIKFGMFFDWALENGFEIVATGHYARHSPGKLGKEVWSKGYSPLTAMDSCGRLYMAKDEKKDQTYFLAMLKKQQLDKVMFPIGKMLKDEVRLEAKKRGIHVWNKKGTSGICFIGHTISFEDLLKTKIKEHEGEVVDMKGKLVGKHKGYQFYTIGQRHGFEVKVESNESKPFFVVSKDKNKNRLVVGEKKELLRDSFEVDEWNWIGEENGQGPSLSVRIRHGGKLVEGRVEGNKVRLKEKVFGVAPGQVAVLYRGEKCLGGGVIKG
jgi:tRNA-uridine 2-sulfurtransferase